MNANFCHVRKVHQARTNFKDTSLEYHKSYKKMKG